MEVMESKTKQTKFMHSLRKEGRSLQGEYMKK